MAYHQDGMGEKLEQPQQPQAPPFYLSVDDLAIVVPLRDYLSPKSQNVMQTFIKLMTVLAEQDEANKPEKIAGVLGESLRKVPNRE